MTDLSFTVIGTPAAQGSKRHLGRGIFVEQSTRVQPWRQAVAAAAHNAAHATGHPGFVTGPVRAHITFWIRPPKNLPKRTYTWPWHRPDIDKYLRSTFDALTDAGTWTDDSQVVTIHAAKRYANPDHPATGATIRLAPETAVGDQLEAAIARHPAGRDLR